MEETLQKISFIKNHVTLIALPKWKYRTVKILMRLPLPATFKIFNLCMQRPPNFILTPMTNKSMNTFRDSP